MVRMQGLPPGVRTVHAEGTTTIATNLHTSPCEPRRLQYTNTRKGIRGRGSSPPPVLHMFTVTIELLAVIPRTSEASLQPADERGSNKVCYDSQRLPDRVHGISGLDRRGNLIPATVGSARDLPRTRSAFTVEWCSLPRQATAREEADASCKHRVTPELRCLRRVTRRPGAIGPLRLLVSPTSYDPS